MEKRREKFNNRYKTDLTFRKKILSKQKLRASTQAHKTLKKNWHLKTTYGMSLEDFSTMLAAQDNKCCLCNIEIFSAHGGKPLHRPTQANVDHDHTTNKVRGILCTPCNIALGIFEDKGVSLQSVLAYQARGK